MIVGVPKDVKDNEFWAAVTPEGACELALIVHDAPPAAIPGAGEP